ncbi:MAG: HIT domain-containing protein [Paludibacter sp.]|nr:HIT domain-containing protein [Paludibacter sp.]
MFKVCKSLGSYSKTATAMAFLDSYPVNPRHTLIVPKRHIANYFELTIHMQRAL